MNREKGFYWIKASNSAIWEVAEWLGDEWQRTGAEYHYSDKEFDEIGSRVYPPNVGVAPNWIPVSKPPEGGKPYRMVLVRRSSDEILMGRCLKSEWLVYFNDVKGVQSSKRLNELKQTADPIVDWQELPITQQQFELQNKK